MRVLTISADNFEDSELTEPVAALKDEGIQVDIASLGTGTITGKKGAEAEANLDVSQANPGEYDMLLLPGGKAPAELRQSDSVLSVARAFMDADKPIAAICHGPQILISAGLVKGRSMTCYESVASELKEAGADYKDEEVVTDGNLITSRNPADIPAFIGQMLQTLKSSAPAG